MTDLKPNPEQKLRMIAEKSEMTLRQLNELFQAAMIDDEKTRHRMIEQRKQEVELRQLQLMELQFRNESMQNALLTGQLERKIKWKKFWNRFSRKPKSNQTGRITPPTE